jgi:hypothetical protein
MKNLLHKICVGVLLGTMTFNLTGCMLMSDSQKTAVDIYTKKRTTDEMMTAAQSAIDDADYLDMTVNYRIEQLDKNKSMSDIILDGDTWHLCALKSKGGGYWKGSSTRQNEVSKKEEAYILKQESGDEYDLYKTNDDRGTWIKTTSKGIWSGLSIISVDYSKLIGVQGLSIDKEPVKKDDILQWKISGTLTYDEARNFLSGLESSLDLTPDSRLNSAESVTFEMYMDTDNHPLSVYLSFIPNSSVNDTYVYKTWEVRLLYTDYDAYSDLTIPDSVTLAYITQEQQKQNENSFLIGGDVIEIQTTAAEEEESESVDETIEDETKKTDK